MEHKPDAFRYFILDRFIARPYNMMNVQKAVLKMESEWIFRLNTTQPHGLNLEIDFSPYI